MTCYSKPHHNYSANHFQPKPDPASTIAPPPHRAEHVKKMVLAKAGLVSTHPKYSS